MLTLCVVLYAASSGVRAEPSGLAAASASGNLPGVRSHRWHNRDHHDPENNGFKNIWTPNYEPSTLRAIGWIGMRPFILFRDYDGIPRKKIDVATLHEQIQSDPPRRFRAHWIGQATALIEFHGRVILTDPIFAARASPVSFAGPRRLAELPLQITDLPRVDLVVISHSHYDHLDMDSVAAINEKFRPLFLAPLGVGALLRDAGVKNVVELDWYQYVDLPGQSGALRVHCTPARHFSNRSLADRNETLWAGWMLENIAKDQRIFFAGDTGYSPHFREVRERLGAPMLAILPIGAYLPRWFMREVHVDPAEAVQAFVDLDAEHFLGMHWGTFDLADEPILEPRERTRTAAEQLGLPPERVHILPIGGQLAD